MFYFDGDFFSAYDFFPLPSFEIIISWEQGQETKELQKQLTKELEKTVIYSV